MVNRLMAYLSSKKNLASHIDELEEEKRELERQIAKLEMEKSILSDIKLQLSEKQEEQPDIWNLIVTDNNQETWVRKKLVSFISPIEETITEFKFSSIIDGCMVPFSFSSKDSAVQFRNILLNISSVPSGNTYDTTKEKSDISNEFNMIYNRKPVTQDDIDNMTLCNKMPDDIKYSNDSRKVSEWAKKHK